MSENKLWIETAENIALFRNQGKGGDASRLLEMTPTNRTIAGKEQAVIMACIRFAGLYYESLYPEKKKYTYLNALCDIIEGYQLTMSGEENSRRQFMKVSIASIMREQMNRKGEKAEDITATK